MRELMWNKDDSLLKALFVRNRGEKRTISVLVSSDVDGSKG